MPIAHHLANVTHLLTGADPGTCIERQENEWVGRQVLVDTLVKEPIRVILER